VTPLGILEDFVEGLFLCSGVVTLFSGFLYGFWLATTF